jgi:hypothetical protein
MGGFLPLINRFDKPAIPTVPSFHRSIHCLKLPHDKILLTPVFVQNFTGTA